MRYPPLIESLPKLLHGGDYNPDQWQHEPAIIQEDYRLQELAHCNAFSIGIFSWVKYEPAEGQYDFGWLDKTMDDMAARGHQVFLATPTAAMPTWMALKYPEALRTNTDGRREQHGGRQNHCRCAPVLREKVAKINTLLSQRYSDHPALGGWHISNEYGGQPCYCEHCQQAFQDWLKQKYSSLEDLNQSWWSSFWGQTYLDWSEVNPRNLRIDGLQLDWKRFITWATCDFMRNEVKAIRKHSQKPVTTNLMGFYPTLDYHKLIELCDFAANDSYPHWYQSDKQWLLSELAMTHDLMRSLKGGRPFLLMECSPSTQNSMPVLSQKRPGIHRLEALMAVSHGADGVMYFQWRKGLGGFEKFHGAVVDHEGSENSRTFRAVAEVGGLLQKLEGVRGCGTKAEVALVYDWDARWAIETSSGPIHQDKKQYHDTVHRYYRPFWHQSLAVDIIESVADFTPYKLVVLPQLYLIKPGVVDALRAFAEAGGTVVISSLSGIVDENNRCWPNGFPGGGLRELCGVWAEEIDEFEGKIGVTLNSQNPLGLTGNFSAHTTMECIHAEGADVLAVFAEGLYAGSPAITVNTVGKGHIYYLAARFEDAFLEQFTQCLSNSLSLEPPLSDIVDGITVRKRSDGTLSFYFLINSTEKAQSQTLHGLGWSSPISGETDIQSIEVDALSVSVVCGNE